MATQVIKTTFQLKRGTSNVWKSLNPILAQGEPGFEYDTGLLKIGNGLDAWIDLPYVNHNDSSVVNAPTIAGFPAEGRPDVIYKAENEKQLYQWNSSKKSYEILGGVEFSALAERLASLEKVVEEIVKDAPAEFDTFQEVAAWIMNYNPTKSGVEGIAIGSELIKPNKDGIVEMPIATQYSLGLVKASEEIEVNEDGSMEVGVISFSKIAQEESVRLVFDSGDAFDE